MLHSSAFYPLRHTMLDGTVLRSSDPSGLHQEMGAQLTVYQVLRIAMVDAVESQPGIDPDRVSFTIALETAREQIVLTGAGPGSGHRADTLPVLIGAIGLAVLDGLLPPRRLRTSARAVKAARSRYPTQPAEPRPCSSRNVTGLAVLLRPAPSTPLPPSPSDPLDKRMAVRGARPTGAGHRNRVFHLMSTEPERTWRPLEVATILEIENARSFATQKSHWATEGLLRKVGYGTYTLAEAWKTSRLTAVGSA
jgi:hypothetical protein